jgi:hypothetical protein
MGPETSGNRHRLSPPSHQLVSYEVSLSGAAAKQQRHRAEGLVSGFTLSLRG